MGGGLASNSSCRSARSAALRCLFASTRRLFAFLLAQETPPAFARRAERRVTISLRCARTDERLGADAEVVELDDGSFCLATADPGGVRVASALCQALCLAARADTDEIVRWAPVPPADGDAEAARKSIGDLIELVQRIRLGHRSAA